MIPGIEFAGMSNRRLMEGTGSTQIRAEQFDPAQEADYCFAQFLSGTRVFVDVMDTPLVAGRDFRDNENSRPPRVTIINETMMRRFWLERPDPTVVFVPVIQQRMTVHLRTRGDPRTVLAARETFRKTPSSEFLLDPSQVFSDAQARAFSDIESTLRIISALGLAALILSACGTWFMTRQYVRLSRREICIRLALGALPDSPIWSTVRRATGLAAI